MAYTPSPRPTFDGPTHIPYESVTKHLWGDAEAGEVADWIYVSSDKIHQLVFGLLPGKMFRHSDSFRTVFGADVTYLVLSGVMVLCNPETGEVHRVAPGEAAFFRRDTWHHAMNYSTEPLRVLEFFSPPPSQGTSGAYARARPYLHVSTYTQNQHLEHWPAAKAQAQQAETIRVVRANDLMWRLEGHEHRHLVGIMVSTEHLTVGTFELLPGQQTDLHIHGGDEGLYVLEGTLHVRVPEHSGPRWHELKPGDGFYIPQGAPHQYYNISGSTVRIAFGVAPRYLADA